MIKNYLKHECEIENKNENTQEINQEETSDAIEIKGELAVILDLEECIATMAPTITEAIMPP